MRALLAGCTHFIIGRDMAGSKSSVTGEDFYGAYDAQNFAAEHAKELGMQTVPSLNITYTEVWYPLLLDSFALAPTSLPKISFSGSNHHAHSELFFIVRHLWADCATSHFLCIDGLNLLNASN